MVSIQAQRLEQRFALWDANGDGRIDLSDYEAEARRIIRAFGEPEHTPKAQAVIAAYRHMWNYAADQKGIGAEGALGPDEFIELSHEILVERGDEGFAQVLRPCIQSVADLCDEDGDGQVDSDEFGRWIKAIGVDANPHELFRRLDTNGSGLLSVDELVHAVRLYHAGQLEVPLLGK